ncbi:DNA replication complex GINS protein SLD5 isoform X1 [Drosophila novamexicana]|uniref:DNA replication complex GINS protein SLD5 isoform X1 n=1 Tax=Drosophila novamexicana TaxID=47314 RepID=UPI0011E5ADCD|nr:DNA replication complex GINS protein SLD5 isoform X1 [Drosophila novamexicana]
MSDSENLEQALNEHDLSTEAALENANEDDDEEEDAEPITAQKVLEILETAWTNEMCAPELLQHQTDMLELMLSQVAHMEEQMKDLDKNDFRFVVHQMELERIRTSSTRMSHVMRLTSVYRQRRPNMLRILPRMWTNTSPRWPHGICPTSSEAKPINELSRLIS